MRTGDESLQPQMQHIVDSARKATGAKIAILIVSGDRDDVEGEAMTGLTMSHKATGQDPRVAFSELLLCMLRSLNATLDRATAGRLAAQVVDAKTGEVFASPTFQINKFTVAGKDL